MPAADGGVADAPVGVLRVRYSKTGKIRFTGHRDVVRMWERALRRSGLPVAWSEGFSPRPRISLGLALPTGAESLAEYLDVVLDGPCPLDGEAGRAARALADPASALAGARAGWQCSLAEAMTDLLPQGMAVQAVGRLPDGSGSLQQEVSSCSWELEVLGLAAEELATRVERFLAAPKVLVQRERKGRAVEDDLRPAVLALAAAAPWDGATPRPSPGPHARLHAELATRPRGVRPRELLAGLGPELVLARACRSHQWIERDGARWEPLAPDAGVSLAVAAHAAERAT